MAAPSCPRCGRHLTVDGKCPSCEERGSGRVGDATRGRIEELESGWSISGTGAGTGAGAGTGTGTGAGAGVGAGNVKRAETVPVTDDEVEEEVDVREPSLEVPLPTPPRVTLREPSREDATTFDPRTPPPEPLASAPLAKRHKGIFGDVRYAFAVMFGMARGRKELGGMKERLWRERAERTTRLGQIARAAVADANLEHRALVGSRERLAALAEDRALHRRGAAEAKDDAAKADEERADAAREAERRLAELAKEIEVVERKLAPLEKQQAERRKALDTLRAQLADVDKRISGLDRRAAAAKDSAERAGVDADMAVARAERQQIIKEEPLAHEAIAALAPQIGELQGARDGLREDVRFTREQAAAEDTRLDGAGKAARARHAAEQQAVVTTDAAEQQEYEALGEQLDRERPREITARFRPIDEHAAAIGAIERRLLEIEDAAAGVHRPALYRGLAIVIVTMTLIGVVLGKLL